MTVISREEAADALKQVAEARERVALMQRYRHAAPFLILWGVIWMVADSLCDFLPQHSGVVWNTMAPLGVVLSWILGHYAQARRGGEAVPDRGLRWGLTILSVFVYFAAAQAILPQTSPLQCTAWVSIFFAVAYMLVGIWSGWRIFAIGSALVALILFGYFGLGAHQFLWIGLVSGGALVAGGLWLRKV
jgi:hypothetical protein